MRPPKRRSLAVAVALGLACGALATPASAGTTQSSGSACGDPSVAKASGALRPPARDFSAAHRDGNRVTARSGRVRLAVGLDPLAITISTNRGEIVREIQAGGLYVKRGEGTAPIPVTTAEPARIGRCAVELQARFGDGTAGTVTLQAQDDDTVSLSLAVDDTSVTHWGEQLVTSPDELVYGLTARTVDDLAASETAPQAVGSLNRKGERVKMYVTPTISQYQPFYQSSKGYGLLVDGTLPGVYDLGATDPAILSFEFELDPQAHAARYFVFAGDHYRQNDAYSRLTGRPAVPPKDVFLHWQGYDVLPPGDPVVVDGVPLNPTVADDLARYEQYGIPPGIYHFDRPWAVGTEGIGEFRFDPARFPDPVGMLKLLHARGWKTQVWISEWVLDERAAKARTGGWLAPGSEREPDLTNPEAVRSIRKDLEDFLRGPEGRYVDGFFIDRTEEIVPSSAGDVYHDGRTGRQIHNAYPVLMQRIVRDALNKTRPDGGWFITRGSYTGTTSLGMNGWSDTHSRTGVAIPEQPDTGPSTDLGLRSVLISLQREAFMGQPYYGTDVGGYTSFGDREVFARWLEVGAASPLMILDGKAPRTPWNMPTEPTFDQEVLDIFTRYVKLHHALQPYLVRLSHDARRTGAPLVRPLAYNYPRDPNVADRWDEWQLGNDLLVAPVWESGARSRSVYLPKGAWVDFWDRSRVIRGPVEITEDVPLGRMPLYVQQGSPLLQDKQLEKLAYAS